jgi:hypothetical protein
LPPNDDSISNQSPTTTSNYGESRGSIGGIENDGYGGSKVGNVKHGHKGSFRGHNKQGSGGTAGENNNNEGLNRENETDGCRGFTG